MSEFRAGQDIASAPASNIPIHSANPDSSATPDQPSTRASSVRFSEDTNPASRSSMPSRRNEDPSDEITPIRQAEGHVGRTYNATDVSARAADVNSAKPQQPAATETQGQESENKTSWYKRLAEKYGSVSLDNKGSVARDHLALERTFLAWLRTSLAFASIGIAVTQLFRLNVSIQTRDQSAVPQAYGYPASQLPYSPLVGHGLPQELIPLLQQLAASALPAVPSTPTGATLLDQLSLLPPSTESLLLEQPGFRTAAFDEHAAEKLRRAGKPLGATFIGISIVVLCVGFHRYFEAQYWIMRGKFPASRGGVALIGLIAAALIIASLVVVVVVAPGSYQKK